MKYIIYGAGAVGGSIGARLHLAGLDVTLIARGKHLEALRDKGLRYRNPSMDKLLPIDVAAHPCELALTPDTVVFMTMKSQHMNDALNDLAACGQPDLHVICCQNGVANEPLSLRRFRNTYGMVVFLPATHINPGEVIHYAQDSGGLLDTGRYPHGLDAAITQVATDLTIAGFSAYATGHCMRLKYAKLLQNLGNALQAIAPAGPQSKAIMKVLRDEALAAYDAAGIDCASQAETRERFSQVAMGEVPGITRSGGSSWQSMSRGTGDIEADYLNGEISYLGRMHGVPTPANDLMTQLANEAARLRRPPGSMALEDLAAMLTMLE